VWAVVDLVVVGGGFWGAGVALLAGEAGWDVMLLDSGESLGASRSAAGIVCEGWYRQATVKKMMPGDWTREEVTDSIRWLERFGLEKTGEVFSSYRRSRPVLRDDCYLLPSPESLLGKVRPTGGRVLSLREAGGVVEVRTAKELLRAGRVVVAAGAFTDTLLKGSNLPVVGVVPLRGRAVVGSSSEGCKVPHTYMSRPYTHWTSRPWPGGGVRVGDTVERGAGGPGRLAELELQAGRMVKGYRRQAVLEGLRPVCGKMVVGKVSRRVIVAVGGHRVGLGLTGLVARRALSLL
jgi:glycine/D-amino acid oxidase-like deaminating enzyme